MSDIKVEKKYYGWNEFERDIKHATAKLSHLRGQIKNVYGIPRGGLVVAVTLSHYLNVPLILDESQIDQNTLICDDIADSGQTLVELMAKLQFVPKVFTLHFNGRSKFIPDVWINKKKMWVVYPWETIKTSKYDNR